MEQVKRDIESVLRDYEPPRLRRLGTLAELTLGTGATGTDGLLGAIGST